MKTEETSSAPFADRKLGIQLLEQRYATEQKFMLHIESGDAHGALTDLWEMRADVQYVKQIGTTLEMERVGAGITRTTVRIAALHAHLPIYLVDQISHANSVEVMKARSADEIEQATDDMIREFCRAILKQKEQTYSALVQAVLYHLEHSYREEIVLDDIAAELGVSKSYLITRFRRETGSTPVAYLNTVRMRNAAALLTGSMLSIAEAGEAVGIMDANYFAKLFKKEYGVTPHV